VKISQKSVKNCGRKAQISIEIVFLRYPKLGFWALTWYVHGTLQFYYIHKISYDLNAYHGRLKDHGHHDNSCAPFWEHHCVTLPSSHGGLQLSKSHNSTIIVSLLLLVYVICNCSTPPMSELHSSWVGWPHISFCGPQVL
jgi:hypothetical protein